jgi:penicillin amidase
MRRRVRQLLVVAALCAATACHAPAPAPAAATSATASAAAPPVAPPRGDRLVAAGLEQPVEVLVDRWGVAHIYARSERDLFFAQGFVAAQERLFQMELWKRAGQGRLAEIAGRRAIARDVWARRYRRAGDLAVELAAYGPRTGAILASFTAGINAAIARIDAGAAPLPEEFRRAGFRPEPWRPEDCLSRMSAVSLSLNARLELFAADLVAKAGTTRAGWIFAPRPRVAFDPAPGVDLAGLPPQRLFADLIPAEALVDLAAPDAAGAGGSNAFAIGAALSKTGAPILATDPHRAYAVPSLRMLVHLVAPGWNVIGAGEPALPGVAIGHNEHIAWGVTYFPADQQDLFWEELDPSDPTRYRTERGWAAVEVERFEIAVRGEAPQVIEARRTRHGPILWEDGRHALAMRWVVSEPGTAPYLGGLALDQAHDWPSFRAAALRWLLPSSALVYADRTGALGEQVAGIVPKRTGWTGLLPVAGASGRTWDGFLPLEALPSKVVASDGFAVAANHQLISDGFGWPVGFVWARFRIDRIVDVLGAAARAGRKLDVGDLEALQRDVVSTQAVALVALLPGSGENQPAARQLLAGWDGALHADSPAAALYAAWRIALRSRTIRRLVPPAAAAQAEQIPFVEGWFDALLAPATFGRGGRKVRDALLRDALDDAVAQLRKSQGDDPTRWRWGAMHTLSLRHALGGPTGAPYDLGPLERPGDASTIAAQGPATAFEVKSGASFSAVFDLGDWDRSRAINMPGQSGRPGSPHYADLLPLWQRGESFPLAFSRGAVEQVTTERLLLEPASLPRP